ncbi:2-hydroxyacid dehydrogenase [Aquimarina sp. RZ0]|uniref:2-hydroxyacid dehydrogenase n=1 Tax=Aquimarina sp. RZ0 TaxID=2607730 RepID=UPI0011F29ECF|nr:2-hydroxyacid dehydrogenase [Aquimarina sp. RZ0]KAA1242723.1 2-hydroxyacid dehydrogenase [Aquimarina sp. RZ0]
MKILIYSAKDFEIPFLEKANNDVCHIKYVKERLTSKTAMMSLGFDIISIFSADDASSKVLELLKDFGIEYITLRSAGYDNINLKTAQRLGIKVGYTPEYSPHAIAEHAVALLLALNRKLITANHQVHSYNFSLSNLVGFDLKGKTVGIIGMGSVGKVIAKILHGFGCRILAYDLIRDEKFARQYGVTYLTISDICIQSDVLMLSIPLTTETSHMIHAERIQLMKRTAFIINVARGAVVNTLDIIDALKKKQIAAYGSDVYEYESGIFFYDHSVDKLDDDLLQQLIDFPNVLITPHQAFATAEALTNIAETTFHNINCWKQNEASPFELIPVNSNNN